MDFWEEVLSKSFHKTSLKNKHPSFLQCYAHLYDTFIFYIFHSFIQSLLLFHNLYNKRLLIWLYILCTFWSEVTHLWPWPIFQTWVNLLSYHSARSYFSFLVLQSRWPGCHLWPQNLKCSLQLVGTTTSLT